MMKRLLTTVLCVCVAVVTIFLFCNTADAATKGIYTYEVSNGEATITDCDTSASGSIAIPTTLGGYPVTGIGGSAFSWCSSLTSITIPNSVTSIGSSAFSYCSSLKSIAIPDSVTSIGLNAFYGCGSLAIITIPNSVSSIAAYTFSGCSSLTSIAIPDSVTSIGDRAFENCSSLTSITIPNGVTGIGYSAFEGCNSLITIEVSADNPNYCSQDGVLFNKDCTELLCCPGGKTGSYVLPDGVTSIGGSAFAGCSSLASITIPNGVTGIGYSAFEGCSSLASITIPDSVTSIGGSAFAGCSSLASITIPDSVTSIEDSTFCYCNSLTAIEVSADNPNYRSQDGVLFNKNCTELLCCPGGKTGSYVVPNGVTSIGHNAFSGCSSLTSIAIPDSVTSIGDRAFENCSSLTSIVVPNGVTSIGFYTFYDCSSLTSVTIANSVTSIGVYAFNGCNHLTDVYYSGSKTQWINISISAGNEPLTTATIHYCEHNYESTVTPPSCMEKGYTTHVCSICGDSYTDTYTDALGHDFKDTVIAPTCTEQGYTTHACTRCGDHYEYSYVPALGHDLGDWTQTKAPTCTEAGESCRDCSRCDHYEMREVEALGHNYKDTVTFPTCTQLGYTTHACTRCSYCYVDSLVPALGHSYEDGICVVCGEKDPEYKPIDPVPPIEFNDVPEKAWYAGAVEYVVSNGLMNGVGNGRFDPEGTMTRAMLVTVLWRYEGSPEEGANDFTDVPEGQWYTQAVAWAAENKIVGGVGHGRFDPEGEITREQMATILFRYAQFKGIDVSKRGDLSVFPDGSKVESWAKDAMQWAVAEGLINGSDGKLLPQGNATRAQVATILMRFIKNIV